jgi:iron complex outermembrane recepter protein
MRVQQGIWCASRGAIFLAVTVLIGIAEGVSLAQEGAEAGQNAPPTTSQPRNVNDILNLDIEQLGKVDVRAPQMNIEVTSVTKQESTVGHSAAAIYVITSEMIHRSEANNIPDLLRMVPGLEVAQIDAHTWAITSRGFNNRYGDKLLVLIDGRTVYSPITSGVYWDVQDVLLEDIERIEVIRGPGSTVWGSNAVNGVINIITKRAKDTQGALVTYGGGAGQDNALGGFHYGSTVGEDLHYRIYGKHKEEAPGFNPTGPADDDWRQGRAGFRADWEPDRDKSNLMTVQGDCYVGRNGVSGAAALPNDPWQTALLEDESVSGNNVLARWTHKYSDESDWSIQTYFDQAQRGFSSYKQNVNTFDVEFQHRFPLEMARHHEIIWGADHRQIHDEEACDDFSVNFTPAQRSTSLFSMFVQDEIELVDDRLFFTVGSKFEHNDYSGFEFQPSGRILYTPDKKHSFWGAISRAVRTPSRGDQDVYYTFLPESLPPETGFDRYFPRMQGNPNARSENLVAYEIGYRAQPVEQFAYDITLFYNAYESLVSLVPGGEYVDDYGNLIVPFDMRNTARGQTYGVELSGEQKVSEHWRLSASYSYLHMQLHAAEGGEPNMSPGASPCNQVKASSSWDLGDHWQFDMSWRYVDALLSLEVPSYITMDLRLAYQPNKHLEFAVIGRNLLDDHHLEFREVPPIYFYGTEVQRSVYGKVTYRY